MPTETRTDFVAPTDEKVETVENVDQDGTTTTVEPEVAPDRQEHHHDHTTEDGGLSPLCAGGGCPDGTVK